MSTAPQERETEVVSGTIVGITQKGTDEYGNPNKWQVAVQPQGSQYSKNLWTKDEDLVRHLSTQVGQPVSAQCGVSHWQNQSGQAVRSLWINGVGPAAGATVQQAAGAAPQPAPQQGWSAPQQPQQTYTQQVSGPPPAVGGLDLSRAVTPDQREGRIMRQTATKVAAILLGYLPAEQRTYDTLLLISQRLMSYYEEGMESVLPQRGGDDNVPPDDGIPF